MSHEAGLKTLAAMEMSVEGGGSSQPTEKKDVDDRELITGMELEEHQTKEEEDKADSEKAKEAEPDGGLDLLLESVPEEVVLEVFSYLSGITLVGLRTICRRWKALVEDDAVWRGLCRRDFERMGYSIYKYPEDSWLTSYKKTKSYSKFVFSPDHRYHSVSLTANDQRAVHTGSGSHHPVRSKFGVSEGTHYFEFILHNWKVDSSLPFGTGVMNSSVDFTCGGSFTSENDGIGWYAASGNVYERGLSTMKLATYGQSGDRIGIWLDMSDKDSEQHRLVFFKNAVQLSRPIKLVRKNGGEIYPILLMSGESEVQLKYWGPLPPNDITWVNI
jgi:hypothetical protein